MIQALKKCKTSSQYAWVLMNVIPYWHAKIFPLHSHGLETMLQGDSFTIAFLYGNSYQDEVSWDTLEKEANAQRSESQEGSV
jgi:hypothetical protein